MTLFSYPEHTIRRFKEDYNLDISGEFLSCADNQLTQLFYKYTGLKFGKNLCLSWASTWAFFYNRGETSEILFNLYVNHHWNNLIIFWKSKSGRIYDISDTNIDIDDVEFDFENLEVELFKTQLQPKLQLSFDTSGFNYKLILTQINLNATFRLTLKPESEFEINAIIDEVENFIKNYNIASESNQRKDGVIHNVKSSINNNQVIYFEIDLGSTGTVFLQSFLSFLSDLNKLLIVEIL